MVQRMSIAESSREIKKRLKRKFNQNFSVTISGGSINVRWTDGASLRAVENFAAGFHGSSFDGMIDLKESLHNEWGNDFIFFRREYSKVHMYMMCAKVAEARGIDIEINEKTIHERYQQYGNSALSFIARQELNKVNLPVHQKKKQPKKQKKPVLPNMKTVDITQSVDRRGGIRYRYWSQRAGRSIPISKEDVEILKAEGRARIRKI